MWGPCPTSADAKSFVCSDDNIYAIKISTLLWLRNVHGDNWYVPGHGADASCTMRATGAGHETLMFNIDQRIGMETSAFP